MRPLFLCLPDKALSLHLLFLSVRCFSSGFLHKNKAVMVENLQHSTAMRCIHTTGFTHTHTHIRTLLFSHPLTSARSGDAHARGGQREGRTCAVIEMWVYIQRRLERHMKAWWPAINAPEGYWHASVPVRAICAAPLRNPRSLVSTDTQLFDSLSRLCHVDVGLSLRLKTNRAVASACARVHAAATKPRKQSLALQW